MTRLRALTLVGRKARSRLLFGMTVSRRLNLSK